MSSTSSPWVTDVAEADFERAVLAGSRERPVVVDFWAPWCGPCRMLGPTLERLVAERNGQVALAKVNVDEAQGLAAEFGVEAIPMVVAFRDGRPVLQFTGVLPEEQLRDFLDRLQPSPADRLAHEARGQEEADPAEAERLYRQALAATGDHAPALVGLARVLLARGKDEEASDLLGRAVPTTEDDRAEVERLNAVVGLRQATREFPDEATLRQRLAQQPDDAGTRYQLGSMLAAAGRYREALEMLLSAAERDKKLGGEAVKEMMVRVFHVVGVRSELADTFREKLVRVLY